VARTAPAPAAPRLDVADARFVVAAAGFHRELAEALLDGAQKRLVEAGATTSAEVVWVPGAFELPLAAKTLAETGVYAAIICVGAVIRGETPHFEYVCSVASSGLTRVALDTGVPCTFGVLTTDSLDQAWARAGGEVGNAGADAADAAVALVNLIARPPV
jgi:6,7-dimethyl-8-ribityllumazine synthase